MRLDRAERMRRIRRQGWTGEPALMFALFIAMIVYHVVTTN